MLLVLLLTVAVLGLVHHWWTNRKLYKLSWQMPGPVMFPIIGNAYSTLGVNNEGIFYYFQYLTRSFANPMRFWLGTKLFIFVTQPDDMQVILNAPECLSRDDVYDYIKCFTGDGLVTLQAAPWKDHRKYLNPCFSLKILQSYMPIFNGEVKTLVNRMELNLDKGAFNLYDFMDALTLDVVCQTTLGTQMNIQKNENMSYLNAANTLLAVMTTRIYNPLYHSDWLFGFSKWANLEKTNSAITNNFVDDILQKKKVAYKEKQLLKKVDPLDEDDTSGSFKKPQVFIDQLLKLSMEGNYFTDEDVKNEANTIVATGYESTALITSYCILMLAMNPDIQDKCYEEVRSVVPNREDDVAYDDLNKLDYLERTLKETMRLFPTVPVVARKVDADFQMNKFHIPAGTHIVLGVMEMQRDPKIWGPRCEVFDPDNFLPENFEKIHPYAYVPFSAGPRNCLGTKYAYMLMKIMMVHLINHYRFTTDLKYDEMKFRVDITLKLVNKHMVRVHRRE